MLIKPFNVIEGPAGFSAGGGRHSVIFSDFEVCGALCEEWVAFSQRTVSESIHAGTQNFADPETADFENDLPYSSSVTRAADEILRSCLPPSGPVGFLRFKGKSDLSHGVAFLL